ncbi:putative lipoprotein lprE [Mycobacterium xenopi 3993]|nr:putative lipoprotein lprE [Mycobacterium xenopi 3993]
MRGQSRSAGDRPGGLRAARDPRSRQPWNPNRWRATTTSARSCRR